MYWWAMLVSQLRLAMCDANAAGVACVTVCVTAMPVAIPLALARSRRLG
jgi:hypothetical protein